ncbi:hypothetical protein [Phytoactinopolyspora limicola]|uniref:hypothetical protein n=1 Tax=Phytoactinopolyspora limicola TaxID=2715536 RepID=UPI00140B0686|nr:hypothetical protein [Phytoactinopolyspora limicola]
MATFTQPYLPEESVVELRDEVPIEVPEDATDDEAAVVEAFGRYYAVVEQHVWGVELDEEDYASVATGERLQGLLDQARERHENERVTVGPPVIIEVLSVTASSGKGHLDVCLDVGNSFTVGQESVPRMIDQFLRFDVDLDLVEADWKVSRLLTDDEADPCEAVFE